MSVTTSDPVSASPIAVILGLGKFAGVAQSLFENQVMSISSNEKVRQTTFEKMANSRLLP